MNTIALIPSRLTTCVAVLLLQTVALPLIGADDANVAQLTARADRLAKERLDLVAEANALRKKVAGLQVEQDRLVEEKAAARVEALKEEVKKIIRANQENSKAQQDALQALSKKLKNALEELTLYKPKDGKAADAIADKAKLLQKVSLGEQRIKSLETQIKNLRSSYGANSDPRVDQLSRELEEAKKRSSDLVDGFALLHADQEKELEILKQQMEEAGQNLAATREQNSRLSKELLELKNADPKGK